jgi:hypothetical protein
MSARSGSSKRNSSQGDEFSLPSPEGFDKLVRDQKLDDLQSRELRQVLYHVDEDLKGRRKTLQGRQPRQEPVRRHKRVAKCLDDLEYELGRWQKTLIDFLPPDTLEEIGLQMSFSAMEAALEAFSAEAAAKGVNKEIQLRELGDKIESLAAEVGDFRMAQLEEQLRERRKSLGLKIGDLLLTHYIRNINQSIKKFIELDRLNRGGRPPKSVARDLLLFRLAEASPVIISRRPTATAKGPFVRLCADVFLACGLSTSGIERAVEKVLNERKKRRSSYLSISPRRRLNSGPRQS